MKCPVCGWPLSDHYKKIVYDHTENVPTMIKKPMIVFSCKWCRQVYTVLSRALNISYQEGERLCKNI